VATGITVHRAPIDGTMIPFVSSKDLSFMVPRLPGAIYIIRTQFFIHGRADEEDQAFNSLVQIMIDDINRTVVVFDHESVVYDFGTAYNHNFKNELIIMGALNGSAWLPTPLATAFRLPQFTQ
jgi:hypothetical protein